MSPLRCPEPPTQTAPSPCCGAPLIAHGFWPATGGPEGYVMDGVDACLRCSRCDEAYGPITFIARTPDGNCYTESPHIIDEEEEALEA